MASDNRSGDDVRRFVEHFALLLTEAGLPRMPSRVFACVLAEDSGQLTAAELAERLGVSPAAISGAVRYLTQVGMLVRGRDPDARVDHFRLHDDVWAEMYTNRLVMLRRWEDALAEGVAALGTDSAAGRRLEESRDFFEFLEGEVEGIVQRWQKRRAG